MDDSLSYQCFSPALSPFLSLKINLKKRRRLWDRVEGKTRVPVRGTGVHKGRMLTEEIAWRTAGLLFALFPPQLRAGIWVRLPALVGHPLRNTKLTSWPQGKRGPALALAGAELRATEPRGGGARPGRRGLAGGGSQTWRRRKPAGQDGGAQAAQERVGG